MTPQGDVSLLNDPVARRLLSAPVPAQLAYTWTDGTPRVLPIWFHWDQHQIVLGTPAGAPKVKAIENHPRVAVTINTYEFPYKSLCIRGSASVQVLGDIVSEYALMAQRIMGDGADSWLQQVRGLLPAMGGMARIAITPEWVAIHDFEQRFPSAMERAIELQPAS